jgi:flagellar hook-basal body complex protein FliE
MTAPIGYPEAFGTLLRREPATAATQAPSLGERPKLQPTAPTGGTSETANAIPGTSFAEHVAQFVSSVDTTQKTAEHKAEEFAVGHHNDIHGTMINVEQAEISLHLLANVRNRVVDLYREVMRMGS